MSDLNYFLLIVGMSIATMLPRIFPVFFVSKFKLSPFFKSWLSGVPYAALGVLIFPGILTADPETVWTGIIGGAIALSFCLSKFSPVYAVIFSVLSTSLFKFFTTN